ncbi:MAG: hypothetical protein GXO76_11575 [Calditrichaeota bacterium]|nr:hypothetical protein [Calditrichota bacterium]
MNLKDKLSQLDRQTRPGRLGQAGLAKFSEIRNLPEGEEIASPEGVFYRIRKSYDPTYLHGNQALARICRRSLSSARFILRQMEYVPSSPENLLFLDTETTGLSGGVGTMAFLVGVGYFRDDSFIIEQLFARDFREERAALIYLKELTRPFTVLVSFNGKSFDWPLLVNRWIFNRIAQPDHLKGHLDLLYLSRRLWRRTIGDCTLGNIERKILAVHRQGDVPGYLVPQLYFEFLRSRDAAQLRKVFHHNRLDILSLVTLLSLQLDILDGQAPDVLVDHVSLGKLFLQIKEEALSLSYLENNHEKIRQSDFLQEVNLFLARLYKRQGERGKARSLWNAIIATGQFQLEAYEELAKCYEHVDRDYESALQVCLAAKERVRLLESIGRSPISTAEKAGLEHRINRLEKKLISKRKTEL